MISGIPINPQLLISTGTYSDNDASSVNNIANARLTKPDEINTVVAYAYGSGSEYGSKNFPLLFATVGQGRKRAIKSLDTTFTTRMYGKPKKTDVVGRTLPNQANPGKNGTFFKIPFKSKFFMKNMMISAGGLNTPVTVQVYGDPVRDGNEWIYTVKPVGIPSNASIPAQFLAKGTIWASGVVKVGLKDSRGTDQRQPQTPFRTRNQLSAIRRSYAYKGNVANKKLDISFSAGGKQMNLWTDWEMFNNELQFMVEKNEDLIFSTYNADANGVVHNLDSDSGDPVPSGMGLWDQIPNRLGYTVLTENKIKDFIDIMLYNNNITGNKNSGDYTIMGGQGLLQEMDKAMKRSSFGFLTLSDKYVRGKDSMNLQYGAYFTEYLHSSGKVIKFVHDPSFDTGAKADASPRHPLYPNMSTMSFCGVALDFSMVDTNDGTQPNIQVLYEEGREMKEWLVLGGADVPAVNMMAMRSRASDIDASSQHFMCTQGIHLNYPHTCGKIICEIS